jgi:isovaleryl-CoA dehydrogenase
MADHQRIGVMQAFSGLSNDEMEILSNADRFAQAELYPLAQKMDDEEWWPKEIFPKIGATGYFGVTAPEIYGGSGMDVFTSGLILQAFSRWNHALGLVLQNPAPGPTRSDRCAPPRVAKAAIII